MLAQRLDQGIIADLPKRARVLYKSSTQLASPATCWYRMPEGARHTHVLAVGALIGSGLGRFGLGAASGPVLGLGS